MKLSFASSLSMVSVFVALAWSQAVGTIDDETIPDDINGSNFTYPWPVKLFKFFSQTQELEMAFMDIQPTSESNGKTVVLFHGKNFCGPTWAETIRVLAGKGYRVIAPDQVGFCKSSKPDSYQFSLSQFAWNTRGLLNACGVGTVSVIGHSMGGMMTARFGLQYPDSIDKMIMVDPVGLEDYVQKGVPYISIDQSVAMEAASTYQSVRAYEQAFYYVGQWKSEYDTWVNMIINIYNGCKRDAYIRNQAQIVDMVLTSPVAPYFKDIKPRTLLIVGDKDRTAIGSQWAPPYVAAKLGHFDALGPQVAQQLRNGELHRFADLGHAPQISNPQAFHEVVVKFLEE